MYRIFSIVLSLTLICTSPVFAESFWDGFKDPKDGKLDFSGWSEKEEQTEGGFLPVPIIISEPALGGLGLGAALVHMREKGPYKNAETISDKKAKQRPPRVSGIAGAYTLNDSWIVGGGHQDNWLNDSLRYSGGLGYTSVNLDFYGIGEEKPPGESSVYFNIKGFFLLQDLKYRLLETDFFVGTRYMFLSSESAFESGVTPGISDSQKDADDGGLGLTFGYDTRNNTFTPTRGSKVDLSAMFQSPSFGGDFTYQSYKAAGHTWIGVHQKVTLGLRLDARWVNGDTPFYAVPYIQLRGIPAMRYQDEIAVMGEVEATWQVSMRWSVLGFVGSGRAAGTLDQLDSAPGRNTFGTGFRYLIARKYGLHSGVDVARGPEDTYVYIQIGSAW
jgi:hypothetical protein